METFGLNAHEAATVKRLALVLDFIFTAAVLYLDESRRWLQGILGDAARIKDHLHIGLVLRSDSRGTKGNFGPLALSCLTGLILASIVMTPDLFLSVMSFPWRVVVLGVTIWRHHLTVWTVLLNIILSWALFLIGILLLCLMWAFVLLIPMKTISWASALAHAKLNVRLYKIVLLVLFAASWLLTFVTLT